MSLDKKFILQLNSTEINSDVHFCYEYVEERQRSGSSLEGREKNNTNHAV